MSATIKIHRFTGSGAGSGSDVTGINTRADTVDSNTTADTANPIQIPASGTNNSFWVTTTLDAVTSPATVINNVAWFTDGADSFGTGVTMIAQNANVGANAGYRQATGTAGVSGTLLNTTNHTGLTGAPVNAFTFTSGSPKTLTGSLSNPTTGEGPSWTTPLDFIVYALQVSLIGEPGAHGGSRSTHVPI